MFLHRMGLPGAQRGRSLSKMPRLTQLDSPSKQPIRAARQAHTHVSISLGSADRPLATNSKTWVMNVEPPLGSGFPVRGGGGGGSAVVWDIWFCLILLQHGKFTQLWPAVFIGK